VHSAAVVQRSRGVLRQVADDERRALAGGDELTALVEAAIARHGAYVERTVDWVPEFVREYQRGARQIVERELRLRLLERREQRDVCIKSGEIAVEEVTAQVRDDLMGVAEYMERALIERAGALVAQWAARLELDAVHMPGIAVTESADVVMPAVDLATVTWQQREVGHGVAGAVGMVRSALTGRSLAGVLPGGLAMGTGLGIVLTGLSWGTSEWLRTKVHDQQGALAFVQAAFARAQIELEATLREHALALQPVAQVALQQRIDERRRALATDAARLQQRIEAHTEEREAARESVARRLADLEPSQRRLDEVADRLTAFLRTATRP
jgi:hypothetical protein